MSSLTLVLGPMFSGKTEYLIRYYKENQNSVCIKPNFDTRYSSKQIVSHSKQKVDALICNSLTEISTEIEDAQHLIIDEIQFFDNAIVQEIKKLTELGKIIIASGLNLDYKKDPFTTVTKLIDLTDSIIHLKSNCSICNGSAEFTYRKTQSKEQFLLGANDVYEPRCEKCFDS